MSVKDTLTPEGKRFQQELKKLQKLNVKIGFEGGKAFEEDGTDILDIAMWNELGTVNSPSRPFMREAVDGNESIINEFLKQQKELFVKGQSAEVTLHKIGVFMKGLVQDKIVTGSFTANAPSTVEKKGSATPLIDTGNMRQSVNFVVKGKGDK